jgi:hypothetical protein
MLLRADVMHGGDWECYASLCAARERKLLDGYRALLHGRHIDSAVFIRKKCGKER